LPQNVNVLMEKIAKKLTEWLEKKPTGRFIVKIEINQGGIRGKKVGIIEDI